MKPANKLTELLQVQYPIVQAPMLVVTTAQMVAEVCNVGCLGSVPLGYANQQKAKERIREVKALTNRPFAVNVFAYDKPTHVTNLNTDVLRSYYEKYAIAFFDEIPTADPYTYYTNLMDVIIEEEIAVVSFHFGIPGEDVVKKLKSKGIVLIATATCVEEARMIAERGLDIIVAQGIEAGGNRGTFIEGNLPEVALMSLVPQIIDAVDIPVVAAGGIMQAKNIKAAFELGAEGVQMGSAFLRCKESGATESWKNAIALCNDTSTVVTNVWSGRYGRCISNNFVKDMEADGKIFASPIQNFLTNKLREAGRQKDIPEIQSLWAGQSAKYAQDKTAKEVLEQLIAEVFE
jgi:nitronate monooxygenase